MRPLGIILLAAGLGKRMRSEVPKVLHRLGGETPNFVPDRRKFGDQVQIDVVDPRNEIYLIPVLVGDYRRYHPPLGVFLKTLFFGISPASVIVNGRAMHVGELPTPDVLVEEVGSLPKKRVFRNTPRGG